MNHPVTRRALAATVLALGSFAGASPALGAPESAGVPQATIPAGRALAALSAYEHVLVSLRGGPAAEDLVRGVGGTLVSAASRLWQLEGSTARAVVPLLANRDLLRFAEPDRVRPRGGRLESGDPLLVEAWHLGHVGADAAEPPGPGVPITFLDTGLDLAHPEFAARPDVVLLNDQAPGAYGGSGYHGTVVISTAAAPADGIGTVGVYPRSVVQSFDLAALEDSEIIAGIEAALRRGPSVINLSLGGPGFSRSLYEAVMRAVDAGSIVVAAAGNDFLRGNPIVFPAAFPHVVTVGATDLLDAPAIFSSESRTTDIAAPGVAIPVQDPVDPMGFSTYRGTSVAAPIVSAAAAWVWTQRPDLDPSQLVEVLRRSAQDLGEPGFDDRSGFGMLDIPAALAFGPPAPDPLEPNDDIDLVADRGVLTDRKPPLTASGRGRVTLTARLDEAEDPVDVYRVVVPAGRTLVVSAFADADVGLALWRSRTRSVYASGPVARRNRLSASDRRGPRAETVSWRNETGQAATLFVELWVPDRNGPGRAAYRLELVTRR